MSNDSILESIEKLIEEVEGKMQKEMKNPTNSAHIDDLREWLKHLHEKRNEIMKRMSET